MKLSYKSSSFFRIHTPTDTPVLFWKTCFRFCSPTDTPVLFWKTCFRFCSPTDRTCFVLENMFSVLPPADTQKKGVCGWVSFVEFHNSIYQNNISVFYFLDKNPKMATSTTSMLMESNHRFSIVSSCKYPSDNSDGESSMSNASFGSQSKRIRKQTLKMIESTTQNSPVKKTPPSMCEKHVVKAAKPRCKPQRKITVPLARAQNQTYYIFSDGMNSSSQEEAVRETRTQCVWDPIIEVNTCSVDDMIQLFPEFLHSTTWNDLDM